VTDSAFLAFLVADGALSGAIYALVGLVFVVVYKASRIANFAVGELVMLAARLVAAGTHALGLGLGTALGLGCAGMALLAVGLDRAMLRPLATRPWMSLIMATIGAGSLMRGAGAIAFAGIPGTIVSPAPPAPFLVGGVPVSVDKLVAAVVAIGCVVVVTWFFQATRTGLALRAIASDPQVAMAVGIDVDRHFALTWAMAGVLSTLAGTLWVAVAGSGFGLSLLGLKVFPIVILGGLDSIPGTVLAAFVLGVLESLAAGYLDPLVGGGFSQVAGYLVLLGVLVVRPYGLLGRRDAARV
jgi:branched-chain amino acid transport system permease protein